MPIFPLRSRPDGRTPVLGLVPSPDQGREYNFETIDSAVGQLDLAIDTAVAGGLWKAPAPGITSLTNTADKVGIGTDTPGRLLHVYQPGTGTAAYIRIETADPALQAGVDLYAGTNNWRQFINTNNSLAWWASAQWGTPTFRQVLGYVLSTGDFQWIRDDGTQNVVGIQRDTTAPSGGTSSTAAFTLGSFYATTPTVVGRTYRVRTSGHYTKAASSIVNLRVKISTNTVWQVAVGPDANLGGRWVLDLELYYRSTTRCTLGGMFYLLASATGSGSNPPAVIDAAVGTVYPIMTDAVLSVTTPGSIDLEGQFSDSQATNVLRRWRASVFAEL